MPFLYCMNLIFQDKGIVENSDAIGRGRKSKFTETLNYSELSILLKKKYGLETAWLQNDWFGADLVAFHPDPAQNFFLWIQLKSRITIKKQYMHRKDLCIAFKCGDNWCIIPHQTLVNIVPESWKQSKSWLENGFYHAASPNKDMMHKLEEYFV